MPNSRTYPSLERKPGGPDNWVERAGGLPKYIERIAKRLHYEKGFTISRAIATAVNTVKRWARMGKVAKYGDPNKKRVSAKTAAQAAAAVASWNAKKAAGKINLSDVEWFIIDMTEVSDEFALDLAEEIESIDLSEYDNMGAGAESTARAILSSMNVEDLAARANEISDPKARAAARARVLELTFGRDFDVSSVIDLASTIAPRNAKGKAKDGRRSYDDQGKWGHGFVPKNRAAKEAKAKGSPIAIKRLNRIYGGRKQGDDNATTTATRGRGAVRKPQTPNKRIEVEGEKANTLANLRNTEFKDERETKHSSPRQRLESSKQPRGASRRAEQAWNEIPDAEKTVRNGKRYVLATFGGEKVITEWTGGVNEVESSALNKRKQMVSITRADAAKMSTAELRQLIKNPRSSKAVRKVAAAALRTKENSNA